VPRIESIDVEVKNDKAKFTIKTERDLVPAHDVLYVDLYRDDKKVKTVEIGPYKRDGGPFTTTISTDGMLGGPNLAQMAAICDAAPTCAITASGGVSSPQDVKNLLALGKPNLRAAIVGKALYDGRTTLKEMNDAAEGNA
jgi:uncharacterized protein related to proFAR isomerase